LILVSLGTDEHPFGRALDAVAPLRFTHELVVQHGHTPARAWPEARWLDFVGFDAFESLIRDADAVVCHGGVGTIMTALSLQRRPIVIPRLSSFGEHVDDHQRQIVEKLAPRRLLVPLLDTTDLEAAIEQSRAETPVWQRDTRLVDAIVSAVDGRD
jgi:UDP-N-acetylglucosamine transferase subunit ALG13